MNIKHGLVLTAITVVTYGFTMLGINVDIDRIEKIDYKKSHVEKLLDSDKKVFVKVGADWCKYCVINEKYFKEPKVIKFFKENNIILAEADMTNRNPEVERFLSEHRQMGIPFYVLLTPDNREGFKIRTDINSDILIKRLKKVL